MQHRLIWFRDDLRLSDHAAWAAATQDVSEARITAVFLTADADWAEFGYGSNRLWFTEQLLRQLAQALAAEGVQLHVVRLQTYDAQVRWMTEFCHAEAVTDLYFNQEYQVNERRRDHTLCHTLSASTRVHSFVDRVILQPGQVKTGDDRFYGVFSPFKKRWLRVLQESVYAPYQSHPTGRDPIAVNDWVPLADQPESDLSHLALTETDAQTRLDEFIAHGLLDYEHARNSPARAGTSRLSPYLARGLLSPRQCIARAEAHIGRPVWDFPDAAFSWINEIIWRDFYHHLLTGFPRLSKNRAFQPHTEALIWRNHPDEIDAWKRGQTGIPIVDAGMRELVQTGWMHNRVRMVVAQFLTKNLLADWRIGEQYFMRYLVDSDLGANNGGWQWSASTGTDAAPYFRVFNPVSQSETHDPEGQYLIRWIPELESLPSKKRHAPWTTTPPSGYPPPIVDLKASRARAIAAFKDLPK